MYTYVLCFYDGSELADSIAPVAVHIARARGINIYINQFMGFVHQPCTKLNLNEFSYA